MDAINWHSFVRGRVSFERIFQWLYLLGLGTALVGLALSTVIMSVGQIFLSLVWVADVIIHWDLGHRLRRLWKNKAALVCMSLFLMYVVGLLWTKNMSFGIRELRTNLPLLIFPLILSTINPFMVKEICVLFNVFIAANFLGTLFTLHYFFFKEFADIRDTIWFNSNIRFGLTILMSIVLCYWSFKSYAKKLRYLFIALMLWFLGMLIFLVAMTSLVILVCLIGFFTLRSIFLSQNKILKMALLSLIIALALFCGIYVGNIYLDMLPKETKVLSELDAATAHGCIYTHDVESPQLENGYWVNIYLCESELREGWNARSNLDFDGRDLQGYALKNTLARYLTGKGLRKDAEGVAALSDDDIYSVEHGIANHHNVKKSSINSRIRTIFWEIDFWKNMKNAENTSVAQRFEFWRVACNIIQHHFWFGVGTGSLNNAQQESYAEMNISLPLSEHRWHPHNHYLAIFATFGIFGLLWFLVVFIYPGIKTKGFYSELYIAFFIIMALSLLVDKMGVTYYALFNSLLLFAGEKVNKIGETWKNKS